MRPVLAWALLAVTWPVIARADEATGATWLPGSDRAIPRTTSASRDAAVFEYAYGPRAQASIGLEPGLLEIRRQATIWRVGLYALAGLENATDTRFFPPSELWRGLVGVSAALELPRLARAWLPRGSTLEIGLIVGHESDHQTEGSTSQLAPPGPYGIPFGTGGDFLAPDVAVRLPLGRSAWVVVRLQDRIELGALPLLVGARAVSDVVADDLHEGLDNVASADVVVRWCPTTWAQPQLALFAQHLFAHDAFADDGAFFRAVAGAVLPGRVGEIEPFVSLDAGNGVGLLVDRRELRLSTGVRYAAF